MRSPDASKAGVSIFMWGGSRRLVLKSVEVFLKMCPVVKVKSLSLEMGMVVVTGYRGSVGRRGRDSLVASGAKRASNLAE